MVTIRPLQGLRYQPEKAGDMDTLTAPPYDVITPEGQDWLYEANPYNIVRLILGKAQPSDSETESVYSRAHRQLEDWRKQGILAEDSQPAFYAYSQSWDGIERRGFIAGLKIESYESGQVLPHEFTLGGPKADRLALMKATGSVLSPIFGLYHDPEKQMEAWLFSAEAPAHAVDVTDPDGVRHVFWPVSDPARVEKLTTLLKDQAVLIADGHHRYETAMAYRDWRRELDGDATVAHGERPWDFTLAFLTNMADTGLRVYPTHRVFDSFPEGWSDETLVEALDQSFDKTDADEEALFWVQVGDGPKQGYVVKPEVRAASTIPLPLQSLDVAWIDQLVFEGLLKQPANALKQQGYLHFIRDEEAVAAELSNGATAFWVHAPSVDAVREVCESGYRMPQKSTYFYPKLLSGLVIYYYGTGQQG